MDFRKNERYFVVCALIVDEFQGCGLGKIVKNIIYEKSKVHKIRELHASQLSYDDKVNFYKSVNSLSYKINYIVLDKNKVNENIFKNKNACFNYLVYLLLIDLIDDFNIINLYITVDNRNIEHNSENSLGEYLGVELLKKSFYNKNIYIKYQDSRKNKNLQAVDMFVNAIYKKINLKKDLFFNYFKDRIHKVIYFPINIDTDKRI